MTTEIHPSEYQHDFKGQKRLARPKLLKLTDEGRSKKKNKFKVTMKL